MDSTRTNPELEALRREAGQSELSGEKRQRLQVLSEQERQERENAPAPQPEQAPPPEQSQPSGEPAPPDEGTTPPARVPMRGQELLRESRKRLDRRLSAQADALAMAADYLSGDHDEPLDQQALNDLLTARQYLPPHDAAALDAVLRLTAGGESAPPDPEIIASLLHARALLESIQANV